MVFFSYVKLDILPVFVKAPILTHLGVVIILPADHVSWAGWLECQLLEDYLITRYREAP